MVEPINPDNRDGSVHGLSEREKHLQDMYEAVVESNKALQEQIKSRWTFVQGLVTFLLIMFAINFGYELWRVTQLVYINEQAESAVASVREQRSRLGELTGTVIETLNMVTVANNYHAQATREYYRGSPDYLRSGDIAKIGVEQLRPQIKLLEDAIAELSSKKQLIEQNTSEDFVSAYSDLNSEIGQLDSLKSALVETFINVASVEANSRYLLKDQIRLFELANLMIDKAPERWEGYHYKGIALLRENSSSRIQETIDALVTSSTIDQTASIDLLNLAELSFVRGDYSSASSYAQMYLNRRRGALPATYLRLSNFYSAVLNYVLSDDEAAIDKFIASACDPDFRGTYEFDTINGYLQSAFFENLNNKKNKVRSAVESLQSGLGEVGDNAFSTSECLLSAN